MHARGRYGGGTAGGILWVPLAVLWIPRAAVNICEAVAGDPSRPPYDFINVNPREEGARIMRNPALYAIRRIFAVILHAIYRNNPRKCAQSSTRVIKLPLECIRFNLLKSSKAKTFLGGMPQSLRPTWCTM